MNLLRFLFLEMNKRCNLRCQHCLFWTYNDDDRVSYLSEARRNELLEELHAINPKATLVTCGGEPLLDLDVYFSLGRKCRQLGLGFYSVTNGTLITSLELAKQILQEGPTAISVSLNSHRRELHDRTRGTVGSFDLTSNAIRLLVQARQELNLQTPIIVMGLLFEQNYRDLDGFYEYVLHDLRADKLKLNILQPTFGMPTGDKFYDLNMVRNPDELAAVIAECNQKYNLGLDPEWERVVNLYHRDIGSSHESVRRGWKHVGTSEPICNTYERNVMVDAYGEARLCFNHCFRSEKLTKAGDLKAFWQGADDIRAKMADCRKPCGISHSVRRVEATKKLSVLP